MLPSKVSVHMQLLCSLIIVTTNLWLPRIHCNQANQGIKWCFYDIAHLMGMVRTILERVTFLSIWENILKTARDPN
jgi:hypothetical protein